MRPVMLNAVRKGSKTMKYAVYGKDEAGEMRLLKRDLTNAEAKDLADEHWRTTQRTAVIVIQ